MPKPCWQLSNMQGNNLRPVRCKTCVSSGRPICSANVWRLTAANSSHVYQCSLLDMSDWTELLESTDGEWKQRNKHCLSHMHVTSYSTRIRILARLGMRSARATMNHFRKHPKTKKTKPTFSFGRGDLEENLRRVCVTQSRAALLILDGPCFFSKTPSRPCAFIGVRASLNFAVLDS